MQNFLIGLCIGVALAIVLVVAQSINAHKKMKALMAEKDKLKQMITDRIDLESEGLAKLKKENEELKKQNENLRVTVSTYSQKPGRKEVARLQVYQLAVDRLTLNSPGFGAAWQVPEDLHRRPTLPEEDHPLRQERGGSHQHRRAGRERQEKQLITRARRGSRHRNGTVFLSRVLPVRAFGAW